MATSSSQPNFRVPPPDSSIAKSSLTHEDSSGAWESHGNNVEHVDTEPQREGSGSDLGHEIKPTEHVTRRSFFLGFLWVCVRHMLKVIRDLLTFVIRGGLGTLTFTLDQIVSVVNSALGFIPGFFLLGYALRICVWFFTLLMWVVYTAIELIFYLPPKLLIVYVIALGVAYAMVPDFAAAIMDWMLALAHSFLHLVKEYTV